MTTCGQIGDYIESVFPLQYAMEWDNVGLLAGYRGQSVERALLCLDITSEITQEAIDSGCQMIISHHPLIFRPLTRVAGENHVQDIVYKAIQHGVCVYSAHTNMDCAKGGTNDMMADILGLQDVKAFGGLNDEIDSIGRYGSLEDESFLYEFIGLLKTLFNTRSVRYTGDDVKKIKRVALCSGSFDGNFKGVLASNPDIFIAGEMKYHEVLDAVAYGLDVALIGHYESEVIFKEPMQKRLSKKFPGVEFLYSQREKGVLK